MVRCRGIVNRLDNICQIAPKVCRLLEISKEQHDQGDALKLKEVFFTRWISFNDTVEDLVGFLESLISCLHATAKDASHGVKKCSII